MQPVHSFRGLLECSAGFAPRPSITRVLFDFDGTLSLIRQGWPEVMVPMFVEMLPTVPGQTEGPRPTLLDDDIMRRNGKQTIYKRSQPANPPRARGAQPKDPLWYKK